MSEQLPYPRLDARLDARLREKKRSLERFPLPPAILRFLTRELRTSLTYHSNALEGNPLTLAETRMILEEGITIGGYALHTHLETISHAQAYDRLLELVDQSVIITPALICELHRIITQPLLDQRESGQFRTSPVPIVGFAHIPPPAAAVPGLIDRWCAWLTGAGSQYPPVLRAALAHHAFVAMHPFRYGNGRVGRLLLNLIALQQSYPPVIIHSEWRVSYFQALAKADTGHADQLVNLVGRAIEQGLDTYLDACRIRPDADGDMHDLPLSVVAAQTGQTSDYLALLVRKGRLAATKRGSRWYSSLAAVERYRESVQQGEVPKGRPPR